MKKWVGILICLLFAQMIQAQHFQEWFQQKKTQIDYLVKQIAGLQIYIEQARKGYAIAEKGLTTIGDIKSGDFTLHRNFFAAFSRIHPRIRSSAQVADMMRWQISTIAQLERNRSKAIDSDVLSAQEINYITGVYRQLRVQTLDNIEELTALLTAKRYLLSDDERMQRINLLHQQMQDQYDFVRWFGDQTDVLVLGRKKERRGVLIGRQLFGE